MKFLSNIPLRLALSLAGFFVPIIFAVFIFPKVGREIAQKSFPTLIWVDNSVNNKHADTNHKYYVYDPYGNLIKRNDLAIEWRYDPGVNSLTGLGFSLYEYDAMNRVLKKTDTPPLPIIGAYQNFQLASGHNRITDKNEILGPSYYEYVPSVLKFLGLLLVMLIGMLFNQYFEIAQAEKKAGKSVLNISELLRNGLRGTTFVMGFFVCPVIFFSTYYFITKIPDNLIAFLYAFQSGFFWNNIFNKINAQNAQTPLEPLASRISQE